MKGARPMGFYQDDDTAETAAAGPGAAAGFRVPCPHCGATEGLNVKVLDLAVECPECSEPVTRQDLQRLIDDAGRLLRWLAAALD